MKHFLKLLALMAALLPLPALATYIEYNTPVYIDAGDPPIVQGAMEFYYQLDGNAVVYRNVPGQAAKQVVWDARTSNPACTTRGACRLLFTPGVGVTLSANGTEYWRTNVRNPAAVRKMVLAEVAPHVSLRSAEGFTLWTGMSRLNWFSVLDNIRLNTSDPASGLYGSDRPGMTDFNNLFSDVGYWQTTLKNTHVFKFYTQPWARYHMLLASEQARLRAAVAFLKQQKVAIGLEAGLVERTQEELTVCGSGVEGVTRTGATLVAANNMLAAGGSIDFIAMDEPYYYSRYLRSTGYTHPVNIPCLYSVEQLAAAVATTYNSVRTVFPHVVLGDVEPLYLLPPAAIQEYVQFIDRVEALAGTQVAFVHDDGSNITTSWRDSMNPLWNALSARRIPYGMIWNAGAELSATPYHVKSYMPDVRWVARAIGRIKTYREIGALPGIHNIIQSWESHPIKAGPETSQGAISFVSNYLYSSQYRVEPSSYSVPVHRFYSGQYMHSYATSSYFGPGFGFEGQAFRVASQDRPDSLPLNLCKLVATGRHFAASGPGGCAIPGVTQVTVLGSVAYGFSPNSSEALYRCRHVYTGSYLATIRPQECYGSPDWVIEGVMGYVQ